MRETLGQPGPAIGNAPMTMFDDPGAGPEPDLQTQFVALAMTDFALLELASDLVSCLLDPGPDPGAAFDEVMSRAGLQELDPGPHTPEGWAIDTDAAKRLAIDSFGEALTLLRQRASLERR